MLITPLYGPSPRLSSCPALVITFIGTIGCLAIQGPNQRSAQRQGNENSLLLSRALNEGLLQAGPE